MIASAGLFTENIYRRARPGRSQRHYVFVARVTSFAVVAGGAGFAYCVPNVIEGLETFWIISSVMGVAFWMGLFWRRTTSAGAWAATLAVFGVWWLTTQPFFVSWLASVPIAEPLRFVFVGGNGVEQVYLPWQMIFYLASGLMAGIVASVVTRPPSQEKLERFFALVRTPVQPGEKVTLPCTLPAGAVVPPKRSIFRGTHFEVLIPSRVSVVGFIVEWVCVVLIIGSLFLIVKA